MLALGLDNGRVMLVDEATGEEKWAVQAHSLSSEVEVAMSPNGRFVASVGSGRSGTQRARSSRHDDVWKIWDAASGELHRAVATHDGTGAHRVGLRAVAFSPCGQRLATGDHDTAVVLWDARTGEAEHRIQREARFSTTAIAFSADGAHLASASGTGSIGVFDATTGAWLRTIVVDDYVYCVSFSPTAISILAIAGNNNEIHLWNIDSGEMIRRIKECSAIAIFSPDGRTIATADTGHSRDVHLINVYDAESGEMRYRMVGHTNAVWTASWCPYDGSKFATGSEDGTCKVWDSSTGALIRSLNIGRCIMSVVWGRDWVRDTQGAMAFAMGHHPRLGAGSQVLELEEGVVRMILDRL